MPFPSNFFVAIFIGKNEPTLYDIYRESAFIFVIHKN